MLLMIYADGHGERSMSLKASVLVVEVIRNIPRKMTQCTTVVVYQNEPLSNSDGLESDFY